VLALQAFGFELSTTRMNPSLSEKEFTGIKFGPMQPMNPQPPALAPRGLSPYGQPARHRFEIVLLVLAITVTVFAYLIAIASAAMGKVSDIVLVLLAAPIILYYFRGTTYAGQRVNGVKMSPTQFPQGYYLVQEAAARFGMKTAPDAYVVLGNGVINAFASGHGFRRFVVVYSDLFEVGGEARQPDALAFVIGHEVGHIAAGHVSYWRQLGMFASNYIPIIGTSLIRAQEYTADNHGFCFRPQGGAGAIGVLGAGKYLVGHVGFDEFANRSGTETGFFVWLVNAMSTHPVLTWRASALRDRSQHGKILFRPSAPAPQPQFVPPPQNYGPPPTPAANWTRPVDDTRQS
jgi:Zn-dependent protease with chaperone function